MDKAVSVIRDAGGDFDLTETIREMESEMLSAAEGLEFEKAALIRDQVNELKRRGGLTVSGGDRSPGLRGGYPAKGRKRR